jgi:hypothetical protein
MSAKRTRSLLADLLPFIALPLPPGEISGGWLIR